MNAQRVIITQVPSDALPERLINERLSDENANGWQAVEMMDYNGLLIIRLEPESDSPPNYAQMAVETGQLVYMDDVLDDDIDSPTYDEYISVFYGTSTVGAVTDDH